MTYYDAIIVGPDPTAWQQPSPWPRPVRKFLVLEAKDTIGGGTRTAEITLPGFRHDICSAIHPLGIASPFFRDLPLADFGLEWITPPVALAHPLDDGRTAILTRSLEESADQPGGGWGCLSTLTDSPGRFLAGRSWEIPSGRSHYPQNIPSR